MNRRSALPFGMLACLAGAGCDSEVQPPAPGRADGSGVDAPVLGGVDGGASRTEVGAVGPGAACATATVQAERVPLDLYLMLDSSYSMLEETAATGVDKWTAVKAALNSFLTAPASAGMGVGLQYFPQVRAELPEDCLMDGMCGAHGPCLQARTCTPASRVIICDTNADCAAGQACILLGSCAKPNTYCTDFGFLCSDGSQCQQIPGYCQGRDVCDVAAYATPSVGIKPLPENAGALMASLEAKKPVGRTPLGPALSGALRHAQEHMARNPGRKAAVVLASDGFPVACTPLDVEGVAILAEAASRARPAVPTFALGVVAPSETQQAIGNLGSIAKAGGTGVPYVINTRQNVEQEFLRALDAIRTTALTCEYKLPLPPAGSLDLTRVNVQYTAGNGQVSLLGHVGERSRCDKDGGWFYDVDPASGGKPSAIVTCDATCATLQGDSSGRVDVVLGCQTVVD